LFATQATLEKNEKTTRYNFKLPRYKQMRNHELAREMPLKKKDINKEA